MPLKQGVLFDKVAELAAEHETAISAHIAGFHDALAELKTKWKPLVQALVGDLETPEQRQALRRIQWTSSELRKQLTSLGYDDLVKEFVSGYPDSVAYAENTFDLITKEFTPKPKPTPKIEGLAEVEAALDKLKPKPTPQTITKTYQAAPLIPWSTDAFKQLQQLDLDALSEIGNAAIREISKQLTMDVVVGVKRADMIAAVDGLLDKTLTGPAEKYVDTAVRAYDRTVCLGVWAEANITTFRYGGPKDNRNREFCRDRVGKTYDLATITGWKNPSGLPVLVFGGGFRCRHYWIPVVEPEKADVQPDWGWVV